MVISVSARTKLSTVTCSAAEEFAECADQQLLMRRILNSMAVPESDFCEEIFLRLEPESA